MAIIQSSTAVDRMRTAWAEMLTASRTHDSGLWMDAHAIAESVNASVEDMGMAPFGTWRDADSVTESNHQVIIGLLEAANATGYAVHRFGDSLVGWQSHLFVNLADDVTREVCADAIVKAEGYPILNEDHWSMLEWDQNHPADGLCYSDNPDCECGCVKA